MKRKLVESTAPVQNLKEGEHITVTNAENILMLDLFHGEEWIERHAVNCETGEFATFDPISREWSKKKLGWGKIALSNAQRRCGYGNNYPERTRPYNDPLKLSNVFDMIAREMLGLKEPPGKYMTNDTMYAISRKEMEYSQQIRENTEENKNRRIKAMMEKAPELPDIKEFAMMVDGNRQFAFWDKESSCWNSSCCDAPDIGKAKHNDMVICKNCGKQVMVKKLVEKMESRQRIAVVQKMDDGMAVMRHCIADLYWNGRPETDEKVLNIGVREGYRDILISGKSKQYYKVNSWRGETSWHEVGRYSSGCYEDEYLYTETDIEGAINGAGLCEQGYIFRMMANRIKMLNYRKLLITTKAARSLIEYLYKGRYYKLMNETVGHISETGYRYGELDINSDDVLNLKDRQKALRLRDLNGGETMLLWLRYERVTNRRIDDDTLRWYEENHIRPYDLGLLSTYMIPMSPVQVMNYLIRQKKEQYKNRSYKEIIEQWADYLSMAKVAKKDMTSDLVYKPRQLKRRHNELVAYKQKAKILEEANRSDERREEFARKMAADFPNAEANLAKAKEKYSYRNEDYMIIVPERLIDIANEGAALHHCAGATNRYYERIESRETYIVFLRRVSEPEIPYYTVEIEPNGTVRQHRSYMDEEPGIEEIRPFLREWQKEVKKRIKQEDMDLQKISERKREENLQDLRAKNNTRVLAALAEDFLEAV